MVQLATLTTERLTLTPLTVVDAEAMAAVYDREQMYQFTGGSPPTAIELRQRYERLAVGWSSDYREQWCNWIVRVGDAAAPIGAAQATVAADLQWAAVAWEIGVANQGNGYASEAARAVVDWLIACGVQRITAAIHPEHLASARVASKTGLTATSEVNDGEIVWQISRG